MCFFVNVSVYFIVLFIYLVQCQCVDGNMEYALGDTYILSNCTKNCTCDQVPDFPTAPVCVDLCQKEPLSCPFGTISEVFRQDIVGSKCTCNKTRCVKGLFTELFKSCSFVVVPWIGILLSTRRGIYVLYE